MILDIGGIGVRMLTQTPHLELFEMTMDEAERGTGAPSPFDNIGYFSLLFAE